MVFVYYLHVYKRYIGKAHKSVMNYKNTNTKKQYIYNIILYQKVFGVTESELYLIAC